MTLQRYQEQFSTLPGFFSRENATIWDSLLSFQTDQGHSGSLLEIGVFHGKSAGILALHADEKERLVLIDCDARVNEAAAVLAKVCQGQVVALEQASEGSETKEWAGAQESDFRWIHVDGDHTGAGVLADLTLAETLLSEHGVICMDDFFSPMYPQITLAACDFVRNQRNNLTFFLVGWNKAYLCRPDASALWLEFVKEEMVESLTSRGMNKFTLYKTDHPELYNCFGIGFPYPGRRIKGLDSDPECVPI